MKLALAATSLLALGHTVSADTLSIPASKDNTLYEDPTGFSSNGRGQYMFAGATVVSQLRRAVMAFDLSAIPPGSTIESARLKLNMSRTISLDQQVSLHRLAADWGEGDSMAVLEEGRGAAAEPGDATWIHRFSTDDLWTTPGGDFDPAPSCTIPVGGIGSYTWGASGELNADVQSWLDNPASNFGWIVICNETTPASAKRFDTRDHLDPSVRPALIINFTPPPSCDPDVNCDGSINGFDIEATEQAVNGDFSNFCQASADLNGDGAENGFDIETEEQRVNGEPC
ncbi:hypothetical protein PHYC_01989 [Phycisphaerales bacterium]|nr:hypothetical protein PHYC_01989 [Phycisphaerales bacterium]